MRVPWLMLVVLGFVGCGGDGKRAAAPGKAEFEEPNAEDKVAFEAIKQLGVAIYEQDEIAARATDLAMPQLAELRVHGWVALPTSEGWEVDFWTRGEPDPLALVRVTFPRGSLDGEVATLEPPEPLEEARLRIAQAIHTARGARFPACRDRPYNHVVLPGSLIDRDGWLVYLLAAHQRDHEAVLGGHARIHVSEDGTSILETYPFSKGCLVVDKTPSGGEAVSLGLVTPLTRVPFETHVFLSRLHHMPLHVVARGVFWAIHPPPEGSL